MKLRELQQELQKKRLDAALFVQQEYKEDDTIFYLLQIHMYQGALVVPARGQPTLFVPGFEYGRIKRAAPVKTIQGGIRRVPHELGRKKNIAVNGDVFSMREKKAVAGKSLTDISEFIAQLRMRKTPKETKLLKQACNIGCEIVNDCIAKLHKFKTEHETARYLMQKTAAAGCELSFPPIVATGANAATPHYVPHGKMHKGFCVIDFGVRYRGYCSDMTRTPFLGKPTEKDKQNYELLLKVQKNALKKLKPSADYKDIDNQARKELGKQGKYFIHRLGHSVGIRVHDITPRSMNKKAIMQEGMVWTIEPGIYVPGKYGMRIEDTAVVTEDGNRPLTAKTPKEFKAISA